MEGQTTYRPILPYLDQSRFTWVFPDLWGYGLSRRLSGFTLEQAIGDVTDMQDRYGFDTVAVAVHSKSSMAGAPRSDK